MIPIRTDTPLRATPYVNYALILINIACFFVQMTVSRGYWEWMMLNPRDPKIYQFFTYQFLHGSFMHLVGNLVFLYVFGNNVNDRLGTWAYLPFYLAGGVFAGIAHAMSSRHPVLGASGSIAAVMGAYLALLPASRVLVLFIFFIITTFEIPGMWLVLLFFVKDLANQFSGTFGGQDSVAYMAHIGGTIFGFGVCVGLLTTRLLPRDIWDILGIIDRWNRRRVHRDMVNRGYNPFAPANDPAANKPHPMMDRIQDLRATIADEISQRKLPEAMKHYLELRAIDPNQVLSKQNQLDVANQLYESEIHPAAADAYELYLRTYPKAEQVDHVKLICGLLYSRYLNRPDRARELLEQAANRLSNPREQELARSELAKLASPIQ